VKSTPHILHVFSTFKQAGPQVRTVDILNRLAGSYRHTVMAMDGHFEAAEGIRQSAEVRTLAPPPRRSSLVYPLTFRGLIRELRPDLVETYNWGAMDALAGARLASVCPIVHTEDGFNPDEVVRLKKRRVWARRALLNGIYQTVVVSNVLLDIALKQYGLRPDKVQHIPNGVDVQRFRPAMPRSRRQELGIAESTLLFGYLGHLRPEKNLALLLSAFAEARLENAVLVFVGDGASRGELEALTQKLGLGARVRFAGFYPDPAPWLAAFDVFAMSSLSEQAPISLLEAMACGLPVVATAAGDTRAILPPAQSPFVVPLNERPAYSRALRQIAENSDLRRDLGRQNRERAERNFSVEAMVSRYERVWQGAISSYGASDLAQLLTVEDCDARK
jgi:glycosyltransferase involved in cell wall biosynthesis